MSIDKRFQPPNHPAGTGVAVPAQVYAARQFGKLLRGERLIRGFSPDEALVAMGLHPVHHAYILRGVEAGDVELAMSQARMLDRKLGIPAPHLMAEVGLVDPHHLDPDDLPVAGRWAAAPTADTPQSEVFRCTAAAVLAFAVAAFLILSTTTAIIGGGPWGVAAAIICGLGAWAALSVGFLYLWCRAAAPRNAEGR